MKVALVSTSDIGHGAGIAAYRLHRGLLRAGIESRLLVTQKCSQDDTVIQIPPPPKSRPATTIRRLLHLSEHALNVAGLQNLASVATPYLLRHPWIKGADLIHLHNIHWHAQHFSLLMLPTLSRTPMLWTLHDMWPMTGHCYYPSNCTRWMNGCGSCPDLTIFPRMLADATALMFAIKRFLLRNTAVTLIAPSEWMRQQVLNSPIFSGKQVRSLHNGIDTVVYYPQDRTSIRTELGLGPTDRAILFVSSQLNDPRKGFSLFVEALRELKISSGQLVILIVGGGGLDSNRLAGFRTISLGYQTDEKRMARIYSAADIQVVPSLQDNLPNVVLESLACGTPVVCFNCGGLQDMVNHQHNGYLAAWMDPVDLRAGIEWLLNRSREDTALRDQAAKSVKGRFDLGTAAAAHIGLYNELIQRHRSGVQ